MTALLWIPLVVPAVLALACAFRPRDGWTRAADLAAAVVVLGTGVALLAAVATSGPLIGGGGTLRADGLTAWLVTTIGAVAVTALWGGLPLRADRTEPDGRYAALVCLFLAAMSLAVLADNLGILWVAVEATTIATAFLVGHHRGQRALEAAWKYVVLGSVGVAIAFLGIVLLYAASVAAGTPTLSWELLSSGSIPLDPDLTRLAVALAVLGFATKAGLAPMHSWLPDAHSQAPAPVSGLMSGVLLSVALYAILRIQAISDAVIGPGFLRGLLVAAGLLSLAVAAALMLAQRDYKRLLAYSSIEHMGIMALGAAVGGTLATTAVLLHMLGHGLVKASMFVVAGRILAAEGSSRIDDVHGLLARRPDLARPLLAGTAALLGFPPVRAVLHRGGHPHRRLDQRARLGHGRSPGAPARRVRRVQPSRGVDDARSARGGCRRSRGRRAAGLHREGAAGAPAPGPGSSRAAGIRRLAPGASCSPMRRRSWQVPDEPAARHRAGHGPPRPVGRRGSGSCSPTAGGWPCWPRTRTTTGCAW